VVRALHALRTLRPFHSLGTLGPLDALRALDALVSLHPRNALGPIFAAIGAFRAVLAAIDAAVFHAVFAAVGAGFALGAQLHPQAVVGLAQPHALELELPGELFDCLRDLLALLRGQPALADAHFAYVAVEQRADLGDELLDVDRTGGIARHIQPNFFALIFAAVLASIFAAIFPPVLLAYIGGCERPIGCVRGAKSPIVATADAMMRLLGI